MSRLIDAEDFERVVKEYCKDLIDHNKHTMDVVDFNADIQGLLDNQPTAFDVDKVVEQLEDELRYICLIEGLDYKEFREAIDVVKAGGIDEM